MQSGHHPIETDLDARGDLLRKVRVDVGGDDAGMAEDFLDGADVEAIFNQVGGIGVAQGVDRRRLVYAALLERSPKNLLQRVGSDVLLLLGEQEGGALTVLLQKDFEGVCNVVPSIPAFPSGQEP